MSIVYTWDSSNQPDDYQSTLRWVKIPPEWELNAKPGDSDYQQKYAEWEAKAKEDLAAIKESRKHEKEIDDRRAEILLETGTDAIVFQEMTLIQKEIAIFCLDRPNQMFCPRDIYKTCQPIDTLLDREKAIVQNPKFSKSAFVREQCEYLSQVLDIGVSVLLDDKFTYGFGFIFGEDYECPPPPCHFESMLGRQSDIQIVTELQGRSKRDREILEASQQETRDALARLQDLHQQYVERNNKFLSENIRSWRVPSV